MTEKTPKEITAILDKVLNSTGAYTTLGDNIQYVCEILDVPEGIAQWMLEEHIELSLIKEFDLQGE